MNICLLFMSCIMEDLHFSDNDDEFVDFIEHRRRPYTVKPRTNPFNDLDDVDFIVRFRLRKQTVLYVLERIEHELEFVTDRYSLLLFRHFFLKTGRLVLHKRSHFKKSYYKK